MLRIAEVTPHPVVAGSVQKEAGAEDMPAHIWVQNAGILLLHPFFQSFFAEFNLVSGTRFLNKASQIKAIHLLHYLATGNLSFDEAEAVFYKILCGLPNDEPVFPS